MASLPDFASPPLVEVALSVQFEPIEGFTVARFGRLWERYRERFPKTEDQVPLTPKIETFGKEPTGGRLGVELRRSLQPRVWFLNAAETELLQVQSDRFVHNWRKTDAVAPVYPRYESIRATFCDEYESFLSFLKESDLGRPDANQCEVTYVNLVPGTDLPGLTVFSDTYSDDFLSGPEVAGITLQYLIRDDEEEFRGRLHIKTDTVSHLAKSAMRLTLTARGAPFENQTEGILRFMDLGREWIVRGFCSITAREQHKTWGRRK